MGYKPKIKYRLGRKFQQIYSLFKRKGIVRRNPANLNLVMEMLRKELNHDFFLKLPIIKDFSGLQASRVRLFKMGEEKFVIKDCGSHNEHGGDAKSVREFIKRHHEEIRAGTIHSTGYLLRTPQVYGKIGNYLVMEHIEAEKSISRQSAMDAQRELGENFALIIKKYKLDNPQSHDTIPAGMHNGKVVLYTVYDYL